MDKQPYTIYSRNNFMWNIYTIYSTFTSNSVKYLSIFVMVEEFLVKQ